MFSYNIAQNADKKVFEKACSVIESKMNGFKKEKILVDVDGTQIQVYSSDKGKIKVYNDYDVDAVYVDSDIGIPAFS